MRIARAQGGGRRRRRYHEAFVNGLGGSGADSEAFSSPAADSGDGDDESVEFYAGPPASSRLGRPLSSSSDDDSASSPTPGNFSPDTWDDEYATDDPPTEVEPEVLLPSKSVLHADFTYTDKEKRSDYFPFVHAESFKFYLWMLLNPGVSERSLDDLLSILREPGFDAKRMTDNCSRVSYFMEKTAKKLPQQRTSRVRVVQRLSRRKRAKRRQLRSIDVSVTDLASWIETTFATPALRKGLLFDIDDSVGDGPVTQFNQTPFFKEPFKYSR